ncbi:PcsB-like coiled-coil domain-containing protein [Ornithinibacillus xuwenensis]|uniref:3D domain-containing protein n=1 Tax=Ornithinibacillus xuwenensis TaxID=3144668 RepID=A0ABU9XGR2_9BACI
MKKLTAITLATAIMLGSAFSSNFISAETADDLKDIQTQREDIKGNLSEADAEISTIMSEIDELNVEIERVNEEIANNEALINETEENISNTIAEIEKLQEEIVELEKDIDRRHEILEERISAYQKSGGSINYLEVLFGAQSFSDFIGRISMVNTIAKSDTSLIEELESDIETVEEKKQLSLTKLNDLNSMKLEQEDALAKVQEQKQQNEQTKHSLEEKQQNVLALIDDLKNKDSNLASLENEVKESIAAAAAAKAREEAQARVATESSNLSNSDSANNGELVTLAEGKTITVTSTAYTSNCTGCTGKTYTGINLKENPDSKVIAVDPTIIPLGSVVYVEGYGYAIAGDIGSAIKGYKIDVFVPTRAEALKWGVRKVKVTLQ